MDSRKDFLSTAKLCRFCLSQDEPLMSLYARKQPSNKSVPLSLKILSAVSVQTIPSDRMPSYICNRCKFFMDMCYQFKQVVREADETTLQYVQNETALEPVTWPPALVKLFRHGARPNAGIVKTVVEGGATVEVSSQDISDSDDDDENVYNVKIGDGTDEGTSACVKVVTSNQDATKSKTNRKKDVEGGKLETGGCWPCDKCDCTYPLQQLLELHIMQKHLKIRNEACNQCDAKFFNKYDLATHQLRHSTEEPFACVACDRKFKRHVLLKRHEKLIHSDLPQHKCQHCPATFLSKKQFEEHQLRHNGQDERRIFCTICDKRFHDKHAMNRHTSMVHPVAGSFACEYCPERFTSVSKLTKHVRAHAGDRPYPCKYCEKSFAKSHHYTRHLRLKHSSKENQIVQTNEDYRCEQCSSTFATQDELIYHSAIHATQNLTCPLCQEKFENVDAVTAHIKSHVHGMEFMCALCELVFTSKEKLENHFAAAHDDEIRNAEEMGQMASWYESEADEDDDDNSINVKEEEDHMVVEIKKPDEFMLTNNQSESEDKMNNTNSEESEAESAITELTTVAPVKLPAKVDKPAVATIVVSPVKPIATPIPVVAPAASTPPKIVPEKTDKDNASQTANIVRKAEEIKRKVVQQPSETVVPLKREKKLETIAGASDKSLRLLEKELQELKRTNTRNETPKTPAKPMESLRSSRRPQIHTSTPKPRSIEERKYQIQTKSSPMEKKIPERRGVKENKKPEESKETKVNNLPSKEEKDAKAKEEKTNVSNKEENKDISKDKSVVKNGASNKSATEDTVRRSARPSKVKDYAKMIRDRFETTPTDDDSDDDDDEEYMRDDKSTASTETRVAKPRRVIQQKVQQKAVQGKATPARKRGRPRKTPSEEVPDKVKKNNADDTEESKDEDISKSADKSAEDEGGDDTGDTDTSKQADEDKPPNIMVAPTGQTLKKVPIKFLPPGVKPLPLPANARPMGTGELCEMQIGKKMVKVQKIVMTKAEVEAMAKKGLVEMKDGTMVLKQGIKIPTDPVAIKSTLVGEDVMKESPTKQDKAAPTRCELGGDA